jgi:predicted DCC family thiol-disulfide oxidoreductase YuxK
MILSDTLWFVYDGECPLCHRASLSYKLKQSVGQLQLVDARTQADHPVMQEINVAGIDLDKGMALKYQGHLYAGKDALHLMALLGAEEGVYNKINNRLFRSQGRAAFFYPFLKSVRNLLIRLKGVGKINNLRRKS